MKHVCYINNKESKLYNLETFQLAHLCFNHCDSPAGFHLNFYSSIPFLLKTQLRLWRNETQSILFRNSFYCRVISAGAYSRLMKRKWGFFSNAFCCEAERKEVSFVKIKDFTFEETKGSETCSLYKRILRPMLYHWFHFGNEMKIITERRRSLNKDFSLHIWRG